MLLWQVPWLAGGGWQLTQAVQLLELHILQALRGWLLHDAACCMMMAWYALLRQAEAVEVDLACLPVVLFMYAKCWLVAAWCWWWCWWSML